MPPKSLKQSRCELWSVGAGQAAVAEAFADPCETARPAQQWRWCWSCDMQRSVQWRRDAPFGFLEEHGDGRRGARAARNRRRLPDLGSDQRI